MNEHTPVGKAAAQLAYRCAASELLHAARLFLGASVRLGDAARSLDPDRSAAEDPAVLALAECTSELLELAAASSPGTRYLFARVVEGAVSRVAAAPES